MEDAVSTARSVRTGRTRAVDVVTEALDRADATTSLNAFTRIDRDGALKRAALVDDQIATGADPLPLAGVPIALKDLIDQEGIATTAGSSFLRTVAPADATVVGRLQRAGAVIIGRTGLHEFAYGFSSENEWWGPVRNPWDPATSPGGSSGGSAVAVASSVAPIGIGTDTGGSVRVPAALCGLVGLKVTHGRIPLTGVFPLAPSLDTVGPLARTVDDAATAYAVLAGKDAEDPWSVDRPAGASEPVDLASLSIGIPHPWVDRTVEPEIRAAFDATVAGLTAAGAGITPLDEPAFDPAMMPPATYAEVAAVHRHWFEAHPERYGSEIRGRLAAVLELGESDVATAASWRADLRLAFERALRRCDILITPTTASRTKQIGQDVVDVGDGPEPYRPALSWFTPLVNQAGLPALALPVETSASRGVPASVQLIGRSWSESRLLSIGRAMESAGLVARRVPADAAP